MGTDRFSWKFSTARLDLGVSFIKSFIKSPCRHQWLLPQWHPSWGWHLGQEGADFGKRRGKRSWAAQEMAAASHRARVWVLPPGQAQHPCTPGKAFPEPDFHFCISIPPPEAGAGRLQLCPPGHRSFQDLGSFPRPHLSFHTRAAGRCLPARLDPTDPISAASFIIPSSWHLWISYFSSNSCAWQLFLQGSQVP